MADKMWNLTADQWSNVLKSGDDAAAVGARLRKSGAFVPWSHLLVEESADCESTVDLGSGRGEHSAVLARAGRQTTLVDWSLENLAFSRSLYDSLGLTGHFCRADITKPLPLGTGSADLVFSCGVFEYFNAQQIEAITTEAFRVARKRVILMVPNAAAIGYRLGKWYMERTGKWEWGGEVPSFTLKPYFRKAGAQSIREFSVASRHSIDFLAPLPGGARAADVLTRTLHLTHHHQRSRLRQGYLLVTTGEKR